MRVLSEPNSRAAEHVDRVSLPGAIDDRLYFAQVREDPLLEIEALRPTAADSLVVSLQPEPAERTQSEHEGPALSRCDSGRIRQFGS